MPKKDFELFERSEFLKSRQLRGTQGSPKGQVTRVPFLLVRFLWASKENEQVIVCLQKQLNDSIYYPHPIKKS